MLIANEFAAVKVELDNEGRGPRLRVEDLSTGMHIYLDPLELQSLAWATHKDLTMFARPLFKERALDRILSRRAGNAAVEAAESILREPEQE